eukprot:jgi/Botrbrau1/13708/Bobra.250_2s0006.1
MWHTPWTTRHTQPVSSVPRRPCTAVNAVVDYLLLLGSCRPAAMTLDPRAMTLDPRAMTLDPRAMTLDPWAMTLDPRAMTLDPRAMTLDPRAMTLDPRAMTLDPRAMTRLNNLMNRLFSSVLGFDAGRAPYTLSRIPFLMEPSMAPTMYR